MFELGYAYLSALSLPEAALPHMETLVAEVNESSSAAVLDDTDVVYVARVPTRRIMSITIAIGTRLPAYATSMGRVLLAALPPDELDDRLARTAIQPLTSKTVPDERTLRDDLDRVRDRGWASVDQELEEGVRSIAAAIRDSAGVRRRSQRVRPREPDEHAGLRRTVLPRLLETVSAIEQDLWRRRSSQSDHRPSPAAIEASGTSASDAAGCCSRLICR